MSRIRIRLFLIILFFLNVSAVWASDDDFSQARKIEGSYFIVYYAPLLDLSDLARTLDTGAADKISVGKSIKKVSSPEEELGDMMDVLFLQVSDILDMHIYSFRGTLKICRNREHLKTIYNNLFGKELKANSLYVAGINTIYVSPEYFNRAVLGHEIAHAIISRYFAVEPPERAAEVLAGYVEYQLRKTTQNK